MDRYNLPDYKAMYKMANIAKYCHTHKQEVFTMATMNVSLPDPMKRWVEDQIKTGHFSNASDYVRALIRNDQEYQDKREALIKALLAGEKSGQSERTLDAIWKDVKSRHGLGV